MTVQIHPRIMTLLFIMAACAVSFGRIAPAQVNPLAVRSEVLIDRNDKQAITGQTEIAFAWGQLFMPPQDMLRGVINLKEAMNRWTQINTSLDQHLLLSDQDIQRMPFVFVTVEKLIELTQTEQQNLRQFFSKGGFLFVDNSNPRSEFSASGASLKQMLGDAIPNGRFAPVPNSHQIYHSFFDFDDGPPLGAELGVIPSNTPGVQLQSRDRFYLEGVWVGEDLVAVYSDKGYIQKWKEASDNEPQLKFGVNLIVYALTKGNTIANRTFR